MQGIARSLPKILPGKSAGQGLASPDPKEPERHPDTVAIEERQPPCGPGGIGDLSRLPPRRAAADRSRRIPYRQITGATARTAAGLGCRT